tara:strand:- start:3278 stop:3793 length:516 start_codon:yes stop_codon:yes gene_type:complete
MNKVLEIIEAKNIFNISYEKLNILTHPKSYLHAIIKFNNGLIKTIFHDTTMEIPIHNSLYEKNNHYIKSDDLNLKVLNNLNLKKADSKKFPIIKILDKLPKRDSLFETVLVSANDSYVQLYLNGKIKYDEIYKRLWKFINNHEFQKFKRIQPKKIQNILNLNKYVRLKIDI